MRALLVCLLLTGCGANQVAAQPAVIDQTFYQLVYQFQADSITYHHPVTVNYSITFQPQVAPILARCVTNGDHKEILVDPTAWFTRDVCSRTSIIYHEMGHCSLGRGHRNDYAPNHLPQSLMNMYAVPGAWFCPNRNYYMRELFSYQ